MSQPTGDAPAQPAPPPTQPPAPAPPLTTYTFTANPVTTTNGPPAPASATAIPAVSPALTAPPPVAPAQSAPPPPVTGGPAASTDPGFPVGTALVEMSIEQREAYWRDKARKHEERVKSMADYEHLKLVADEYERLVEASRTDQERAVDEARRAGRTEAFQETGSRLVEAYVRAAAVGRLDDERVAALLEGLDRSKFVSNGEVDAAKVYAFVQQLAPPPPTPAPLVATPPTNRAPDFGQGTFSTAPPSGLEAGRAAARARFGQPLAKQQQS